ncbi:MAG: 16S rRNA (guanine(966)-N(2))-methyltransferase RsmD [Terriglobales bacterium]
MRVVGGEWGSRRLRSPGGVNLRPTSDRLRESLFDILGPAVAGAAFVDGFAGSGAVGLEAFSRGARPVVWIEGAAPAQKLLRANLAALGIAADPDAIVLARRLPAALNELARQPRLRAAGGAEFVFLDPPYAENRAPEQVLLGLEQHREALAPEVRVIIETRAGAALATEVGCWRRTRLHRLGDSQLAFFKAED